MGLGYPVQSRGALGVHRTSQNGSFTLKAPHATIVLRREHIPVVASSGGAVLRQRVDAVEIEPGGDVTIRSLWRPPPSRSDGRVRLLDPSDSPIAGWYVTWAMNTNTCGPPILFFGPSDAEGWIHLEGPKGLPLTLTREMSVHGADAPSGEPWDRPKIRNLTQEELLRLARDGTITLRIEKP